MSSDGEQPHPEPPPSPGPAHDRAANPDDTVTLVWPARSPTTAGAGAIDELAAPREGLALGPVVLVRPVGRGGMGVVWLGHHQLLGRQVAVKFLTSAATESDGGGDAGFSQFLAESRAAAAVRHPNLVPVYDAGLLGRTPYLVMEYVAGPTLRQVLKHEGRLDLPTTLLVLEDVAAAVDELHRRGVIHRDLKPANVLLDAAGAALVSDFGLALRRPHGVGSSAGPLAGTPAYMAPEAFAGEASARGDVYALGITAFEMLAGAPPFAEADAGATRDAHLGRPLPVQLLHEAGLPGAVVDAIERAAHKRPLFRYKTAADLLRAMRDAAGIKGTVAEPRKRALLAALVGRCEAAGADAAGPGSGSSNSVVAADAPSSGRTPPSSSSSSSYFETISRLSARKREQRQLAPADRVSADETVVPFEPEPERLPAGAVGRHVPCRRCSYNLRATPRDARCPECAWPVADSVRLHDAVLAPASRAAHRRLVTLLCVAAAFLWMPGASWFALSDKSGLFSVGLHLFPASPVGVLGSLLLDAFGAGRFASARQVFDHFLRAGFPLLIAAATLLLPALPTNARGNRAPWRRTFAQWSQRAGAGGLIVAGVLLLCAGVASLVSEGYPAYRALYRFVGPCLLGLAPLTFACFRRAALAARALGRPWLATFLRAVTTLATAGAAAATALALASAWAAAVLTGAAHVEATLKPGETVQIDPALDVIAHFPANEAFAWLAHVLARLLDALTLAAGAAALVMLLRLRRHLARPHRAES